LEHTGLCLLLAVATHICHADVTKLAAANPPNSALSTGDRKILTDPSQFHDVHSASDLPSAIVALCAGDEGKIADPGQRWNATDVIVDTSLPGKRLIWGAIGGEYYVVHYERGGIAHTYHVLVAKLPKGGATPKVIWSAVGGPFKDYTAFVDAFRTRKLDDRMDYAH
jgi:hypothetical protein